MFILVLVAACLKKKSNNTVAPILLGARNQNGGRIEGFEMERDEEGEEEEEEKMTLTEEDYNIYFPIVQTSTEKNQKLLAEEMCSICIDKILNNEEVRKVKYCPHYFHSTCLIDWVKVNESCPSCRFALDKKNLDI